MMPRLLRGLVLALLLTPALSAQSYAERIGRRMDASGHPRDGWGIVVTELDGTVLYAHQADRLFIPASNAKLAVTAAALGLLGPHFTVTTTVQTTAPVVDGVIQGDLVLVGHGDPTFSRRCYHIDSLAPGVCDGDPALRLRVLADQLRQQGIREIRGDLVADSRWFDAQRTHPTWDAYDLGWYYAAPVSALAFNDNALDVRTEAGPRVGTPPTITIVPELGLATILSTATTGAASSTRTYDIFRNADGASYRATGRVPLGNARTEYPAVADPDRFAALALRAELTGAGIAVDGAIRSADGSVGPVQGPPLATVTSRPLADWLFPILASSQNLFSEMLLKQLGRTRAGSGSWEAGLAVQRRYLIDSIGIDSAAFRLVDGSGLSSSNRITPLALTRILRHLWQAPTRAVVAGAMPRSGMVGTLQRRFRGTPLQDRIRAKTGAIGKVNALSGYIDHPDGRTLVFSVIANNHTLGGTRMIAAIDSVVVEIARQPPR